MKTPNILIAIVGLIMASCQLNPETSKPEQALEPEVLNFDYSMHNNARLDIGFNNSDGEPLHVQMATIFMPDGTELGTFAANTQGRLIADLHLPLHAENLIIKPNFIGLANQYNLPINGSNLSFNIKAGESKYVVNSPEPAITSLNGRLASMGGPIYGYLGDWDSQGVPLYRETNSDAIEPSFLYDINVSLPEQKPVPTFNPHYISNGAKTEISLSEQADVWVTFVHEGAGWKNSLGFFTYTNNAPEYTFEIDTHYIVFPNVSLVGSGGNMQAGNKVKIGRFAAGTKIGWFLVANGWNGTTVGSGSHMVYNLEGLNPETDDNLKHHFVLLNDAARQRIVLGIEDMKRDAGSDNDFNDAVFYVTSNPVQAIVREQYVPLSTSNDSDGDGIADAFDAYPNDNTRAYINYVPGVNKNGTILFEDLYPYKGDYDFNDLVVNFRYQYISDAANRTREIVAKYWVRAIGAGYNNGFGIELNIPNSMVQSVTRNPNLASSITHAANGTEPQNAKASIIVFDNASKLIKGGRGQYVNTEASAPKSLSDTVTLTIKLNQAYSANELGGVPFNPFIFVDHQRSVEVHLPYFQPTQLFNQSLFGTGDDASSVATGSYFVTKQGDSYALYIPDDIPYPIEKTRINSAYANFTNWVRSRGLQYTNWYVNTGGNRISANLYQK